MAPTEREKIREFIAERAKDAVDAPILFDCNNAGEAPPLIGRPMKRLKSSHVADVAEVDIDDDNDDDDVDDDDDDDVDVNDIDDDDDIDDIDEVDDVKPKPKRKPTPKRRGRPPKGTKTRLTKQKRKVGRTKKPSLAKKRRKNTKDKILRVVMSNGKVSSKIRITCSGKTAKVGRHMLLNYCLMHFHRCTAEAFGWRMKARCWMFRPRLHSLMKCRSRRTTTNRTLCRCCRRTCRRVRK